MRKTKLLKRLTPLLSLICLLSFSLRTYAQGSKKEENYLDEDENLFINITEDEFYFYVGKDDLSSKHSIDKSYELNINKSDLSLYIKWLNPLKYKVTFEDTEIDDPRIQEIRDFFEDYVSALGGNPPTGFNMTSDPEDQTCFCELAGNSTFSIHYPVLYLSLKEKSKALLAEKEAEINAISDESKKEEKKKEIIKNNEPKEVCAIVEKMTKILNYETEDYSQKSKKKIEELFNIKSPDGLEQKLTTSGKSVVAWDEIKSQVQFELKSLEELVEKLTIEEAYLKKQANELIKATKTKIAEDQVYRDLLEKYINEVYTSLKNSNSEVEGYYFYKEYRIKMFKAIKSKLVCKQMKLADDYSLTEDKVIAETEFMIQRYECITPHVGTGLFYSSADILAYGYEINDQNELVVSEYTVDKNTGATGLFLNLHLDINSRVIIPMLQIGVDPTKEIPYLLLGGGFLIPSTKFSFTGGPIWSWQKELKTLSPGQVIESTSQLEEDIKHTFNPEPLGFYIGVNFSFGEE